MGFRGGYRISERGGGVRVTVKYQNVAFLRARARRFFPLYEVWGSPKRWGGGGPDPQDPPPGSAPGFHFMIHEYELTGRSNIIDVDL